MYGDELLREVLEELRAARKVRALPSLLTPEVTARELSVSVRTVRRMLMDGELLSVTIRGLVRIPVSELERLSAPRTRSARQVKSAPRPVGKSEAASIRAALRTG
jgi:excisionase family DNA binding protein